MLLLYESSQAATWIDVASFKIIRPVIESKGFCRRMSPSDGFGMNEPLEQNKEKSLAQRFATVSGSQLLCAWWMTALIGEALWAMTRDPFRNIIANLASLVLMGSWFGYPLLLVFCTPHARPSRAVRATAVLTALFIAPALVIGPRADSAALAVLGFVSVIFLCSVGAHVLGAAEYNLGLYRPLNSFFAVVAMLCLPFVGFYVQNRLRRVATARTKTWLTVWSPSISFELGQRCSQPPSTMRSRFQWRFFGVLSSDNSSAAVRGAFRLPRLLEMYFKIWFGVAGLLVAFGTAIAATSNRPEMWILPAAGLFVVAGGYAPLFVGRALAEPAMQRVASQLSRCMGVEAAA